jgi:hypothetical protein
VQEDLWNDKSKRTVLSEVGMRVGFWVLVFCGLVSLQPGLISAQVGTIELGADATFDMSLMNSTTSRLSIPGRGMRLGVFVSDLVSIESRMSLVRVKTEDIDAATNLSLHVSGVIHFSRDRDQVQGYVIPTVGLISSYFGDTSGSQLQVGCGVGVKFPVVDYLSFRFEFGYWYGAENEDFDLYDVITVKTGVSLFTK